MIDYREANETDIPFIMNSWLKSHYPYAERAPEPKYYFEGHRKLLERLYRRSKTLVACNPEDSEHIFGYLVHEIKTDHQIYHWAFVKYSLRHMGICKGLIQRTRDLELPLFYTHKHDMNALGKALRADFNPYLMYGDV